MMAKAPVRSKTTPTERDRESGLFYGTENFGSEGDINPVVPVDATDEELDRESGTFYGSSNVGNPSGSNTSDTSMADAYQRLYNEFNLLGLGALVTDAKDLLMKSTRVADMPEALRGTKAYMDRFAGNDARIKAGFRALTPAEYLSKEDSYQRIMQKYGLPADYYKPGTNGKQQNFENLLANDIDDAELEERVVAAQEFIDKGPKAYVDALKQFYPEISRGDLLAYVLDPKNATENIKRKIKIAEVGGAALANGLQTDLATAQSLAGQGVTGEQYSKMAPFIAEAAKLGGQLSSIYNVDTYGQAEAEAEALNTAGGAQAADKRKKLRSLEEASFGGSSGVGALGREKANGPSNSGMY